MAKRLLVIISVFTLFASSNAFALDGVGVSTGFFDGRLRFLDHKDYHFHYDRYQGIPVLIDFYFDARDFFAKWGVHTAGRLDFSVEPFASGITQPERNVEGGCNFLLKYCFPLTARVMPFLKGGLGALYMSQHTPEQSTQWNFLPQAGLGADFLLTDKVALTCEGRFRHLSNAGFKQPNHGIQVIQYLGGISYFFGVSEKKD